MHFCCRRFTLILDFSSAVLTYSILKKTQLFVKDLCSRQPLLRVNFVLCPYTNPINNNSLCCQLQNFDFSASELTSPLGNDTKSAPRFICGNRTIRRDSKQLQYTPPCCTHNVCKNDWILGARVRFSQVAKRISSRNAGPSMCFCDRMKLHGILYYGLVSWTFCGCWLWKSTSLKLG